MPAKLVSPVPSPVHTAKVTFPSFYGYFFPFVQPLGGVVSFSFFNILLFSYVVIGQDGKVLQKGKRRFGESRPTCWGRYYADAPGVLRHNGKEMEKKGLSQVGAVVEKRSSERTS